LPSGKVIDRPRHVLLFDDGSSWSSDSGFRDPVPELDDQIARFVSRKAGVPITEQP
jgi:hypothetical protein